MTLLNQWLGRRRFNRTRFNQDPGGSQPSSLDGDSHDRALTLSFTLEYGTIEHATHQKIRVHYSQNCASISNFIRRPIDSSQGCSRAIDPDGHEFIRHNRTVPHRHFTSPLTHLF